MFALELSSGVDICKVPPAPLDSICSHCFIVSFLQAGFFPTNGRPLPKSHPQHAPCKIPLLLSTPYPFGHHNTSPHLPVHLPCLLQTVICSLNLGRSTQPSTPLPHSALSPNLLGTVQKYLCCQCPHCQPSPGISPKLCAPVHVALNTGLISTIKSELSFHSPLPSALLLAPHLRAPLPRRDISFLLKPPTS